MKIKAIFFDLDDTLVLTTKGDVLALDEVAGVALQLCPQVDSQLLLADWRQLFKAQPWDVTQQTEVEEWRARLWAQALAAQGRGGDDVQRIELGRSLQARFRSSRIERFRFLPAVEALLCALRARGLVTVIITNGHPDVQAAKVEACGARDFVDAVLIGGEEIAAGRHEKPHPSIFARACELARCAPSEAIMVGDNYVCDVQGGAGAGLAATVWINELGKAVPADATVQPTFSVDSVTELPELLDRLEQEDDGVQTA